MNFSQTSYAGTKNLLKYPDHYVNVAVMVSDEGITANADGKKIVPAGTVVGGKTKSVIANPTEPVVVKNSDGATGAAGAAVDAEGVLFYDVDVTGGARNAAMMVHGFIDVTKMPAPPHANAVKALPMIKFCG